MALSLWGTVLEVGLNQFNSIGEMTELEGHLEIGFVLDMLCRDKVHIDSELNCLTQCYV